jgi:hypothetical protein
MFKKLISIAALAALSSTSAFALTNPGFEDGTTNGWMTLPGTVLHAMPTYNFTLFDEADPMFVYSDTWSAAYGSQFGLLRPLNPPSTSSTTPVADSMHYVLNFADTSVATQAGDKFAVRLLTADYAYTGAGYDDSVSVTFAGNYAGTYTYTYAASEFNQAGPDSGWLEMTFGAGVDQAPVGTTAFVVNVTNYYDTFGSNTPVIGLDFEAAPIPEPETYAMMLAGLGALGFMSRRRRSGKAA